MARDDTNKYWQGLYVLGFTKTDWWCAICSLAKLLSDLYGIEREDITPLWLNNELKKVKGFAEDSGCIIWERLTKIFPVSLQVYLYDGKHWTPRLIKCPSLISVDGIQGTEEYDSHFLYAMDYVFDEDDRNVIDYMVFDPYYGDVVKLSERYKKGTLKNKIYSIINIDRI